ncbi:Prolycopene isomerase [Chlorella vulgaris]
MGTCTTRLVTSACHRAQSRCRGSPGRAMATLLGANRSGNGGWRRTPERQTTHCSASLKEPPPRGASTSLTKEQLETDIVVIGSGIGGLCAAALLARYGFRVTVCESHYAAGGAAHGFEAQGYSFDAGPSFYAGLSGPATTTNPLKQVLDAVGQSVECVQYKQWVVYTPGGDFPCICDADAYAANIRRMGGVEAERQWHALQARMAPLQAGAALLPAAAIRGDLGIAMTAGARYGPGLIKAGLVANQLTGPFSAVVDQVVTDPWLKTFLDLECFILSGMTAKDTIAAEMAFMFSERNSGHSTIDYPKGGSKAIVAALIRGIEKHGGCVLLRTHVDSIVVEGGRAAGVRLRPKGGSGGQGGPAAGMVLRARKAVVSNASVWDTLKLLPQGAVPEAYRSEGMDTPRTGSFIHLHLGIDAAGLPPDLDIHHLVVNRWGEIEVAGNEPYELWEGLKRGTPEYAALKEERSQCLWQALERIIPDVRQRTEVKLVGTPLTHERYLRRYKGTYGPAISASTGSFPGAGTPLPGLYRCGDSCQPGIGVPAAAASGMIAANTLAPVWSHWQLLDALGL